jgi:alkanesulfonate monooxygenase SsuD/methylene tetrahydromethanopterin reductase-like flavin-dependent oxidoreductase (luciferase family)
MRDYLSVLIPLLRTGSVSHKGEFYQVDGGFVVPGTSPVPVLVGALSPLMVQVAGELADGIVTGLAGPHSLGEHIVPRLHAAARGRPAPRVVAALPVALCPDAGQAKDAADEMFSRYAGLDNYRRQLEREGARSPGGLAVTGTEAGIEAQLRRLAGLGVTEFWPIIFPVGGDPAASRHETRALLTGLAAAF